MIRAVIFDMDGLMFDTERLWDTFWAPACAELGVPAPTDPAFFALGRGLAGEDTLRHIARFIPGCDPRQVKEKVWGVAAAALARGVPCKPGLRELLDWLRARGIPCAVASSSPRAMIERNLQTTDTARYFSAVICGAEIEHSKPAPDIFLLAARRLGVPIEQCLVLEDSHNGVRAGHASGAVTVMVPDLMPVTDEMKALYDRLCPNLLAVRDLLAAGAL